MNFTRKSQIASTIATIENADYESRTLWQEIIMRFRRNKSAMIGMYILLALVAVSLATIAIDFVTDNRFYDASVIQQNLPLKLLAHALPISLGVMNTGGTFFSVCSGELDIPYRSDLHQS